MILDIPFHQRYFVLFVLIWAFLFPPLQLFFNIPITPVMALESRSSTAGQSHAFHSQSGVLHLLFRHEVEDFDAYMLKSYHTHKTANQSWSLPTDVFGSQYPVFILDDRSSENGINVLYYTSDTFEQGLYQKEFDEVTMNWKDSTLLFGISQIHDILGLSTQDISWALHSFHFLEEHSFFVVWSFRFVRTQSHEDQDLFIVSKVTETGLIESQPLHGLVPLVPSRSWVYFVSNEDLFYLYSPHYTKRATYYINGSWSDWEDSGLSAACDTDFLIANQYLVCGTKNESKTPSEHWTIHDLATENLATHITDSELPNSPITSTPFGGIDFEPNRSQGSHLNFIATVITNETISIWRSNSANNTWIHISSLNYDITRSYQPGIFNVDLIAEESKWRLFWDQEDKTGANEIFSVIFDPSTRKWSSVTQVTDTTLITDDFVRSTPSFSVFIVSLSLLIILKRIRRRRARI